MLGKSSCFDGLELQKVMVFAFVFLVDCLVIVWFVFAEMPIYCLCNQYQEEGYHQSQCETGDSPQFFGVY